MGGGRALASRFQLFLGRFTLEELARCGDGAPAVLLEQKVQYLAYTC
jgi:hypothetical protein